MYLCNNATYLQMSEKDTTILVGRFTLWICRRADYTQYNHRLLKQSVVKLVYNTLCCVPL